MEGGGWRVEVSGEWRVESGYPCTSHHDMNQVHPEEEEM